MNNIVISWPMPLTYQQARELRGALDNQIKAYEQARAKSMQAHPSNFDKTPMNERAIDIFRRQLGLDD